MSTVSVVYVGPAPVVLVPALDQAVERGVPVDVPAEVAGAAPGEWVPDTGDAPGHWYCRVNEGAREVLDPGSGLLAQSDNWQLTGSTEAKAALKAHAALAKLVAAGEQPPAEPAVEPVAVPTDTTPEA